MCRARARQRAAGLSRGPSPACCSSRPLAPSARNKQAGRTVCERLSRTRRASEQTAHLSISSSSGEHRRAKSSDAEQRSSRSTRALPEGLSLVESSIREPRRSQHYPGGPTLQLLPAANERTTRLYVPVRSRLLPYAPVRSRKVRSLVRSRVPLEIPAHKYEGR